MKLVSLTTPFNGFVTISVFQWRLLFVMGWGVALSWFSAAPIALALEYGVFALVGVVAAVFASATGAGGGVVFVPLFSQLEFAPDAILATSFSIQLFGMTAGALTWMAFYRREKRRDQNWQELALILGLTVPFAVVSMVVTQWTEWPEPAALHHIFALFSIVLALAIFASVPLLKRRFYRRRLERTDLIMLPLISLVGGVVTAWLSVGVGELVAIYLIFRRFETTFAVAVAVILTAGVVWCGSGYHFIESQAMIWPVIAFAGLGAVAGGVLAKRVVLYFSATNLKLFFASWVLFSGVASVTLGH